MIAISVSKALVGKSKVDESLLDQLEADLIASDVGVETTIKIIDQLENRVAKDKYLDKDELYSILQKCSRSGNTSSCMGR